MNTQSDQKIKSLIESAKIQAKRDEIVRRIHDYENEDTVALTQRLIDLWRSKFPEAANEASLYLHPMMRLSHNAQIEYTNYRLSNRMKPADETWANDVYHATVRYWSHETVFGTGGRMIQIGISCHDGIARHDWRDFQAIKNQIAGPECEAFELYPAESRLLDPSNYFSLWCFPDMRQIRVGADTGRDVRDQDQALAPQRGLAKEPSV